MYKLLSDYSDYFYRHKSLEISATLESTAFKTCAEFNGVRYIGKLTVIVVYEIDRRTEKVVTVFSFEDSLFPDEMVEKLYGDFEARLEALRPREKEGEKE